MYRTQRAGRRKVQGALPCGGVIVAQCGVYTVYTGNEVCKLVLYLVTVLVESCLCVCLCALQGCAAAQD